MKKPVGRRGGIAVIAALGAAAPAAAQGNAPRGKVVYHLNQPGRRGSPSTGRSWRTSPTTSASSRAGPSARV